VYNPAMRHCWIAAVAAVTACKTSDPRGPARPGRDLAAQVVPAPVAGQPVAIGQITRAPTPIRVGVIVPPGTELAAVEARARAGAKTAGLAIAVTRTTARDLDVTADHAARMVHAKRLDVAALERDAAVVVSIDKPNGLADLRALLPVIAEVAADAHGWVVDLDVDGVFTARGFRQRIPGATPDARSLIAVHAVGGGEAPPFLATRGMARLGLPELYVPAVAPAQVDSMVGMINATAQMLILHGDVSRPGELDVDVGALDPETRDEIRKAGGTGKVTWRVRWTTSADESIRALALELEPTSAAGIEGLDAAIDGFFGKPAEVMATLPADDPELLAAGKRARRELADLRAHFANGLPAGERLAVKAPFSTPDGFVEWMWVDVTRWHKDELTGLLNNDPEYVTTLHAGQELTVKLDDVADYIHVLPDGTQVGDYSIEIYRRRGLIPDQ
jgi:uncharacterized protein YegJ (DUF2314 family)